MAELTLAHGLVNFTPQKAETGKPYLLGHDSHKAGLSISHVRTATPPFSIIAVSMVPAIGVDAETSPKRCMDENFLISIAAPEDANIITKARAAGRDPATLLWVLKEAALKASGEVMTDPRHLTLGLSTNGHIQASASGAATAPLPRCILRVFEMHTNATEQRIIVSLAIVDIGGSKNGPNLDVVCDNPNVRLTACDWL